MKTIAIIGAGFSGTMSAIQLMKKADAPLKIYLIEKGEIARGQAYADIDQSLLLNVRADYMGAFPDKVGHFYEWLQDQKIECNPSDFVPRKIYGDYLNEVLQKAIVKSASVVDVIIIKDQAIDINEKEVLFKTHPPLKIDELILAMGLESPAQFTFSNLKNETVTILGTGLSMVDVVAYLTAHGHKGKITAVSRRGLIPLAHHFFDSSVPRPVYDFSINHSLKYVLSTVKSHLKNYEWRLVIDGLRPHNQFLWTRWSETERSQFLRYLRPLWDVHRHRISPLHAKLLKDLVASGQLEIKAIGFKPYTPSTNVTIHCHGLNLPKNTFIKYLLAKKFVTADHFGLGIESRVRWIHVIGPLRRGELWESTAVPEIRAQAKHLATLILPS